MDRLERQLHTRLRPAEPRGAESSAQRAATSAARGTTTRSARRCSARPTTRTCSGLVYAADGLGARRFGSAADPLRACRSRWANTAAGSTSGRSSTTRPTRYADFQPYSVTAPADPRLGEASGRVIDDLWNIIPAKFGQMQQRDRPREQHRGREPQELVERRRPQRERALRSGLTLRGGVVLSTSGDDCCTYTRHGYYGTGIVEGPSHRNCRIDHAVAAEYQGLGTYTIPRDRRAGGRHA